MLTLFRNFGGWFTGSPCRDVNRGVVVGVGRMAARPTVELGLALAIGLLAMAALRAGAAGIPGIDGHDTDSVEQPFVGDEPTELVERPSAHFGPMLSPEPSPIAYALEVLKC